MNASSSLKLASLVVTFRDEGTIELAVRYTHDDSVGTLPSPGSKRRTNTAARIAEAGLEAALEALGKGDLLWGGFATNTRQSTDRIMVERKEHVA